jgi:hypothetical protein
MHDQIQTRKDLTASGVAISIHRDDECTLSHTSTAQFKHYRQSHFDANGQKKKSRTIVPGSLEDAHALCNRCEPFIIWHAIKEIARRHVDVQHWPAVPTEPKNGGEVYIKHDNHS